MLFVFSWTRRLYTIRVQTLGQTTNFRQTAPEIGVSPGFVATSRQELEPVQVADAGGASVVFDHDVEAPHPDGRGDGCGHRGPRLPAARNRDRRLRDDRSAGTVQMELHGAAGACTGYAQVDGTCARAEIDIAVFGPGAVLREAEIEASVGVGACSVWKPETS